MSSEYVHRIPKTPVGGVSSNPPQQYSNAGNPMINEPLTAGNAITIGATLSYGKRIATTLGGAALNQMGNARLERELNTVKKGIGYVGLAIATANPYLVAGAILVDVGSSVVTNLQTNQQINFENERIVSERGGATYLGNAYD